MSNAADEAGKRLAEVNVNQLADLVDPVEAGGRLAQLAGPGAAGARPEIGQVPDRTSEEMDQG